MSSWRCNATRCADNAPRSPAGLPTARHARSLTCTCSYGTRMALTRPQAVACMQHTSCTCRDHGHKGEWRSFACMPLSFHFLRACMVACSSGCQCQCRLWPGHAPGRVSDLHQHEAAAPLGVVVQHALHGRQLELDALEQVHVVHADQHGLPLELRQNRRDGGGVTARRAGSMLDSSQAAPSPAVESIHVWHCWTCPPSAPIACRQRAAQDMLVGGCVAAAQRHLREQLAAPPDGVLPGEAGQEALGLDAGRHDLDADRPARAALQTLKP